MVYKLLVNSALRNSPTTTNSNSFTFPFNNQFGTICDAKLIFARIDYTI